MLEQRSIEHFLTEPLVEPTGLLFHYTRQRTLRAILEGGRVRLNTLDGMNDPRERKEWVARTVVLPPGDVTSEFLHAQDIVLSQPNRLLRGGARIACFTKEREPHPDADSDSLFHRGWARARMWHQYAEEHQGACVVFDYATLAEAIDNQRRIAEGDVFSVSPVKYRDRPLIIPLDGAYETPEQIQAALDNITNSGGNVADLFFTKNTDWQSEDEVRILVLLWNTDPEVPATPLDLSYGESLRAVVLGEEFGEPEWLEPAIHASGLSEGDVLRAAWVDGAPTLRSFRN